MKDAAAKEMAEQREELRLAKQIAKDNAERKAAELAEERRIKREIETNDNAICQSYGLQKGTATYSTCRIRLREEKVNKEAKDRELEIQRQQATEARAQEAARQQAILEQQQQQQSDMQTMQLLQIYQAMQPRPIITNPTNTNCVQTGNTVNCQSY
jgi:hypothetical protein